MTIEERVERLEQEVARSRRISRHIIMTVSSMLVGLCAIAWMFQVKESRAQSRPVPQGRSVIRANAFLLEDENGELLASLVAKKGGSSFMMWDERGKPRATIDGDDGLRLYDDAGKIRLSLNVDQYGPGLRLFDENIKLRMSVFSHSGQQGYESGVGVYDDNGQARAALEVGRNGPSLHLWDENENLRATLGRSGLVNSRTGVKEEHPESSLVLFDKEGKLLYRAP